MRAPRQGLRRDAPARQGELPRHRRRAGREPGYQRYARSRWRRFARRARRGARRSRGQGARQRPRQARGVDEARKIGLKEQAMASVPQTKISSARQDLYRRMDKHNTAPLWEVLHGLIPDEPVTRCKPYLWKYQDVRPLHHRGRQADHGQGSHPPRAGAREPGHARRVVHHAEPLRRPATHPAGRDRAQPPPLAVGAALHRRRLGRVHRGRRRAHHDGPGDFIITPSWTFHDHGNPGNEPVVWMDGLDIRIVELFAAQFHEVYPEEVQPVTRSEGAATARYGSGLVPLGAVAPFGQHLADLQLSLRAQPRVARHPVARPGS